MSREAYAAAIRDARAQWFGKAVQWGVDDCAMAIANIDCRVLGIDPASSLRRRYRSEAGAKRLMGARGIFGIAVDTARRLGWKAIPRSAHGLALDGDRGVGLGPAGPTSVIRLGRFWIGRYERGEVVLTDRSIIRAWSVF